MPKTKDRMTRRLITILIALATTLLVPTYALAGGFEACGCGGQMYTMGNSTNTQYHFVAPFGSTSNRGSGPEQIYWGLISGTHEWDVYGTGITYENAVCPI